MEKIKVILTWSTEDHGVFDFSNWFPLDSTVYHLIMNDNEDQVKLFFDKDSIGNLGIDNIDQIENWASIYVSKFYTEFYGNISEELMNYVYSEISNNGKPTNDKLEEEYFWYCDRVYMKSVKLVNKFFEFCRFRKDNYWLKPYPIDGVCGNSMLLELKARFTKDGNKWHRFSAKKQVLTVNQIQSKPHSITQDDWKSVVEFIKTDTKIKNFEEILTSAKVLFLIGHYRSAITESVAALELVFNMVKEDKKVNSLDGVLANRNCDIKRHMKHLGFSTCFDVLFPIAIDNNFISGDTIKTCYEAIKTRNNVAHNGQQKIDKHKIWEYIETIDVVCYKFYSLIK